MDIKRVWKWFAITEHEKEEKWLRKMHNNGWKFIKCNMIGLYTFEKCQPEDVIYRIDYSSDEIKDKVDYIKLFKDCGWYYVQDLMGFSYFRKAAINATENEEIFCDEESKFEMIKRIFRGRVIVLMPVLLCILLPNTLFSLSLGNYVRFGVLAAIDVLYLIILGSFAMKYYKFARLAKGR